jgi:hypothetical protein
LSNGSSIFQFDEILQTCKLATGVEKTLEANPDLGPSSTLDVWLDKTVQRSKHSYPFGAKFMLKDFVGITPA